MSDSTRPQGGVVRVSSGLVKLERSGEQETPTLVGHLVPFNEWAEIDSVIEGHFLERFAPGSFLKTIQERRHRMRVLYHHGRDPQIGIKPLGAIAELYEEDFGPYTEVPLFAGADYVQQLLPALEHEQFGFSVRFDPIPGKTSTVRRPRKSEHNPKGLPEVTRNEVAAIEFGPTPFPAFVGADARMRSGTDHLLRDQLLEAAADAATAGDERAPELRGRSTVLVDGLREDRRHERSAQFVSESIWAVHPRTLAIIQSVIGERIRGYRPSAEELEERLAGNERSTPDDAPADSPVAVIQIQGVIVPRASMLGMSQQGASIEQLQQEFRSAMASNDVEAVLFNIDSPGGAVDLVPEFAQEIMDARGQKPVWAIANTMAASAAYYIAAACDQIMVSPSGDVGSIGVYSAHQDISKALEMEGIKMTLVSAAPYKVEGNPFEPLSPEAEADMQSKVDTYYGMFVRDVAKGRGTDAATVKSEYGEGRMVLAQDAVKRGMADKVATFDQTLTALEKQGRKQAADGTNAAAAETPEPDTDTTTPEAQLSSSSSTPKQEPEPSVAATQTPRRSARDPRQPWRL